MADPTAEAPPPLPPSEAPFSLTYTPEVPDLLDRLRCSLAPTTYQAGKVRDIRPLFVVLEETSGHTVYVPNNLLFQKVFRRFDAAARELAEAAEAKEEPKAAD